MKSKIAIVLLLLICLGLGVALVTVQRNHARERKELADQIALQGLNFNTTNAKLEEQTQVNMVLEKDLTTRSNELAVLSNNLGKVITDLEKSDAVAKATAEQLRTAQAELVKKDQKINELDGEITLRGKQMDQLTNSIGDLEKLIAATEKKLATSQGEKEFLAKELTRLRAEKAELERQFNDLSVMRAQISKIKEELAISRRLEFIRLNLFGGSAKGGASGLMKQPPRPLVNATNFDLNVELRQGGAPKVIGTTNAAPAPATPPK